MFLRATTRKKDGKEHRYWSVVATAASAADGSCSAMCYISVSTSAVLVRTQQIVVKPPKRPNGA
jgi:hypothetical protein